MGWTGQANAQSFDYFDEDYLSFENRTYLDGVKTVTLHPKDWPLAAPIYNLQDGNPLELHFDVLDSSMSNFMYTLIHCDHDWTPSELDPQEYINGPTEDYLNEYEYSRNTYQRFIHYTLEIPNFSMRITQSGNYLLKVFDADDPTQLVLTRRFMVVDGLERVQVNIDVHQASLVKYRYTHQEVDFSISTKGYTITDPYRNLKVVVMQNNNWNTAIFDLEPRFVKDQLLDYNYESGNVFEGLNEFRLIDLKDTRFTGQGVAKMSNQGGENHALLELNKSRASMTYLQRLDLNGWFFVKTDRANTHPYLDADYVQTTFRLAQPTPLSDGDVYVFGALTNWEIIPEAKMDYIPAELAYTCTLNLKQGLYNYAYAFVRDGQIVPDMSRFEGSHFETENDYTILVYHRPIGLDFDQLIGVGEFKYSNN